MFIIRINIVSTICCLVVCSIAFSQTQTYKPKFWVEGVVQHEISDEKSVPGIMKEVASKGWNGVLFWGASRDGDKMDYYYKSPFLEKQPWAASRKNAFSIVVDAAHKNGLQVMINMEGVNPYHWKQHHWTPSTIKSVAEDLASAGADAVFEECFEVRPDVFTSLARTLKSNGVNYLSGTDPMLLRESNFASLWPETAVINIYNYYLKRDKIYNVATLAQHGSLGLGWAKYWNKPTSLISPVNRNWGIASDYSLAVIPYLCMIRALQFRMDNFIVFGGYPKFDPVANRKWMNELVEKQEKDRPLMNIVVLLKKGKNSTGDEMGEPGWNRLFNSGDAITSGAFNAGYNVVVSDKVLSADAYWIYADGGNEDSLPEEVVKLFSGDKPIFIQAGTALPSGASVHQSWKTALQKCGIDATVNFQYAPGVDAPAESSNPIDQDYEIPYTGYYNGKYMRVTGADVQRGKDLRAGTIIPSEAIKGKIYCEPNKTYGKGPFIAGNKNKYVVTPTCLNWETAYAISHLLSGAGVTPSSNVWGIAGKNVTAFLAIETTELELTIPGLKDGSRIKVEVWDNKKVKKQEQIVTYHQPFKHILREYDFITINNVGK